MLLVRFAVAVSLLTPSVVLAAPRTFAELSNLIVLLLNNATAVLIVAGIVIYFYGVSTNILKFSNEGGEKPRAYFIWGIVVLFVMVSIWGIVRLLQETLFGGSVSSPSAQEVGGGGSSDPFQSPRFEGSL